MSIETISTSKATLTFIEEGIIEAKYIVNITVEIEDVKEVNSACLKMANNAPFALLVIPGEFNDATPEAREAASKTNVEGKRVAMAVVADSFSIKLTGNFYLKFNKPITPTKLFKTRDAALKWLKKSLNAVTETK